MIWSGSDLSGLVGVSIQKSLDPMQTRMEHEALRDPGFVREYSQIVLLLWGFVWLKVRTGPTVGASITTCVPSTSNIPQNDAGNHLGSCIAQKEVAWLTVLALPRCLERPL